MRAIFIFLILTAFLITSCGPVKIAKEVTKASQSIETSVKRIFQPPDKEKKERAPLVKNIEVSKDKEEVSKDKKEKEQIIQVKKKGISKEQKKLNEIVTKQKKIFTINLLNKTMEELVLLIGKPQLIREDGNTISARFDSKNCRLFVFMNSTLKTPSVEYYEIRNVNGKLIDHQKNIQLCLKEIRRV